MRLKQNPKTFLIACGWRLVIKIFQVVSNQNKENDCNRLLWSLVDFYTSQSSLPMDASENTEHDSS